ncbi:MAG: Sensor histidine kinase LiaS [Paracidovorax wautersii]|uniref:Sensor histidine kinase LiaS n=1 Tax=Paracidovorax wautersii TaxID=1177982 RepID=A0A7V8FQM3_9BURK|nr:MAG: Sensor histidine kinase LiaS [Paracidovorax wautersii]
MSLRTCIQLMVAGLMALMMGVLTAVDIQGTRAAVREEILASHRIATQLVRDVVVNYASGDPAELARFLARVGRVRSNDMVLYDSQGQRLYQSPPSSYKQGRDAPHWYAWLVTPRQATFDVPVRGGWLEIRANPTRAVLDGWDDMKVQTAATLLLLLAVNLVVFLAVGRWMAPLVRIQSTLERIGHGDLAARLPPLPGAEAAAIGRTVNAMAQSLQDQQDAVRVAAQTQAELLAERRFVHALTTRIEAERRSLAATLHDELGQSLTAVRSLAHTLVARCTAKAGGDPTAQRAGELLQRASDELYAAMHRLIPRLRPPALDRLGLADALADLVQAMRQQRPDVAWHLEASPSPDGREPGAGWPEDAQIGIYRLVQEALNNIAKHAVGASQAWVLLAQTPEALALRVADDGPGMAEPGPVDGHFGLYGMRERVLALGGTLVFSRAPEGGLAITASFPPADGGAESTNT